ncbi:MAG: hypothetical protein PF447_03675 [Spirochaetaceae bacterium]|nr:hypothetical protein [Spirochaetaceae bacterium]
MYIDENDDWNDEHPWVEGNEWNVNMDGEVITDINAAGGQVIDLNSFTTFKGQQHAVYGNGYDVRNRVAYDYPKLHDGENVTDANTNSTDSPFDFNQKMDDQLEAIQQGEAIPNVWSREGFTMEEMAAHNSTTAPGSEWSNYRMNPVNGSVPPLPSLGLAFYQYADRSTLFEDANINVSALNNPAGVDCLGFVLRSTSYDGAADTYTWDDIFDNEISWDNGRVGHTPETREFPRTDAINIVTRLGISQIAGNNEVVYFTEEVDSDDGPEIDDFAEIRNDFLKIIPGDFITYSYHHIGIIDSVDRGAMLEANSIADLMRAVDVIESTYGSSVAFVFKRHMLQGGAHLLEDNNGLSNMTWLRDPRNNLRNWRIIRLEDE